MAVSKFVTILIAELSPTAKVLADPTSDEFKAALERWTELELKTPGAIVLVFTEDDIVQAIKLAVEHGIPFAPKSGGHSPWSTIGPEGIIIDLRNVKKITVNKPAQTVQIQPGVLNKQLIEALYTEGLCTSLGGGNTIGTVPQAIGGGICALTKICGTTSDNILSARVVTAAGDLITKYLEPIKNLNPMMAMGAMVNYTSVNDGIDPFTVTGDFKRMELRGVPRFDPAPWQGIAESFVDLTKTYPDIKMGGYGFEWTTGKQKKIELDSAWAHRGVKTWIENLSWYTDPASEPGVLKHVQAVFTEATKHCKAEEIHSYQNFSRDTSLEGRFGKEKLETLRTLKKKWDPNGVFTKELL